MDQEHPVSVYIHTANILFIRPNSAHLWYFNLIFRRDTATQNTGNDVLSSLSSPSDTNSESGILINIYASLMKHCGSFRCSACVAGGTRCPPWSTQQKKCPHGENERYKFRRTAEGDDDSALMWRCCVKRREVYRQLRSIYPSLACRQFMDGLQQLEKECGYGEERIPQLREVSAFLKGDENEN